VHAGPRGRRRHDCDRAAVRYDRRAHTGRLDHDGFSESDDAAKTCNTLWGILMGHLKTYAEKGVPSLAFA
jgi:hypothetical protein